MALLDGLACAVGRPESEPALAEADAAQTSQARRHTLRALARLTSGLSHDFNNLLQVLRNSLELIRQQPHEPHQVAGWAATALRVVDRGSRLSAQLLAFAGTQRLDAQAVEAGALVQSMKGGLQRLLGPLVQLQLVLPDSGGLATSDAAQLELAIMNLVLNAMDVMPQGGQLTIACGQAHVEEDAELATGDYVTLSVSDTGPSMSEAVRASAFEPYFTTKALGRGSGLGLSQVYGFVHQTCGAVRIDKRPGQLGNTVRLLLPSAPSTLAAPSDRRDAEHDPTRVLVVVDEPARRQMLLSALNLLGHTQVRATDAASALALIDKDPPDVIVLGLPARPVGPDDLARRARQRRPGVGVVRLDSLATSPQLPLDVEALLQAMRRASPVRP